MRRIVPALVLAALFFPTASAGPATAYTFEYPCPGGGRVCHLEGGAFMLAQPCPTGRVCEFTWSGWGRASSALPTGFDVRVSVQQGSATLKTLCLASSPAGGAVMCEGQEVPFAIDFRNGCASFSVVTAFEVGGVPLQSVARSLRACYTDHIAEFQESARADAVPPR